jgi:hypothetical protein
MWCIVGTINKVMWPCWHKFNMFPSLQLFFPSFIIPWCKGTSVHFLTTPLLSYSYPCWYVLPTVPVCIWSPLYHINLLVALDTPHQHIDLRVSSQVSQSPGTLTPHKYHCPHQDRTMWLYSVTLQHPPMVSRLPYLEGLVLGLVL